MRISTENRGLEMQAPLISFVVGLLVGVVHRRSNRTIGSGAGGTIWRMGSNEERSSSERRLRSRRQ